METIRIEVGVTIDLSDSVKSFISGLFSSQSCKCNASAAEPEKPSQQPVAPTTQKSAPAVPSKPAATSASTPAAPAPSTPASSKPAAPSNVTIEDVRAALTAKVNDHRADIKAKLEELGAPSVTKLDSSKYEEMLNFLNSL